MAVRTFRAPGRVNLIGDHTDYQDGLVLPVALQLETRVTADLGGHRVRLRSDSFSEEVDVAADGSDGPTGGHVGWGRYVAAVTWGLAQVGRPAVGMEGTVASTVPAGAGLASSAALEVALAAALLAAAGTEMDPLDVAQACRRAEVEGVGVPCGIMDQAVAALGSSRGALFLDCRSLATDDVPLPGTHRLVVVDSGVSRELAASGYTDRRHETDQGLSAIKVDHPEVSSLRDATLDMLDGLPPPLRERCRHVVTENARVVEVVRALRNRRLDIVGRLLDHSHHSMAISFAASHPDVDVLAAELRAMPGVLGARMTGGGFGGAVVALVETAEAEGVAAAVAPRRAWVAHPSAGAGEVDT